MLGSALDAVALLRVYEKRERERERQSTHGFRIDHSALSAGNVDVDEKAQL